MTQVRNMSDRGVQAFTAGSTTPILPDDTGFVSLTQGSDYFFLVGDADSTSETVHAWFNSAIAGTFTLELSDMPRVKGFAADTADVTDVVDTTGANIGAWLPWSSTRAEVLVQANAANTNGSVAVTAGASTGCMWMLSDTGAKRMRVRAHVTTTGKVRITHHGKY